MSELSGFDELRHAVRLFEMNNGDVNDNFTAEELLRIARSVRNSGWDVFPDQYTDEQIAAAAKDGTPPKFEETNDGLHALEVSDCYCRKCRREREVSEEETETEL